MFTTLGKLENQSLWELDKIPLQDGTGKQH